MLDLPDQKLDALQRDLLAGLDDGGHHRHTVAGHRDAVEADDGDVLRHSEPGADQRPDGTKGDDVAHRKQGSELGPAGQQAVHGVVCGLEIVVRQAVELVVEDEARILHGVLCAQTAHPAGKTCGRAAQHSDLAVPLCNEVGDRSAGSRPVVHADHRQIGEAQVMGNEGGQHRRNGDVGKSILEVAHAAAQEDDALGLDLPQDLFGGVDLVGVLVQIGDDAVVSIQSRGPLQLHEKVGEEEVACALDDEHQTAGLLDLQLPRVGVGGEPRFPHDLQNVFFRFRPYIGPIVDDTGDSADGTAADAGDVLDRHGASPHFL